MNVEATIPSLGHDQERGKIVHWLKWPDDRVERGDAIAAIETDRTMVEMASPIFSGIAHLSEGLHKQSTVVGDLPPAA